MNIFLAALRQTFGSLRLVWLLYAMTLVLALVVTLPFYHTLQVEDQNSLAFLPLLDGFDYTIYSDFMHRSSRAIMPLVSVGRWLGLLYLFISIFVAGGILLRFSQPRVPFSAGMFLQGCVQYAGRFLRLFGVSLLFVVVGGGIWLIIGTLVNVIMEDTLTERGLFWIGAGFFALFMATLTLVLCIGDYAKVWMFQQDDHRAFRAFGQAGRFVLRHLGRTYGIYWLLILAGTSLFGIYFLIDSRVMMSGWVTILAMLLVQQGLIFARVFLKVWSLGIAYDTYGTSPRPIPTARTTERADVSLLATDTTGDKESIID